MNPTPTGTPPTEPDWDRLDFRRTRATPPAAPARYFPGWVAIVLAALLAFGAAWLWHRGGAPDTMRSLVAAGIAIAVFGAAWAVGYGVHRVSGRAEFVGPIAMVLAAASCAAWPFVQDAWQEKGRVEEAAELVAAMRDADEGMYLIGRGREDDPARAEAMADEQLEEFDRLAALPYYRAGAPKARLAALRAFQRERMVPLIAYQLSFLRLRKTADGDFRQLVAALPQLRDATAAYVAAGDALRARWKELPPAFASVLAAEAMDEATRQALRQEYELNVAPLIAPYDALAAANAKYAQATLETIEFLGRRRDWELSPDGGLLAHTDAMLEQFEVQRARTLHARRNSALAFEALRDVEVAALRRMFPDKVIERREDDYVLR